MYHLASNSRLFLQHTFMGTKASIQMRNSSLNDPPSKLDSSKAPSNDNVIQYSSENMKSKYQAFFQQERQQFLSEIKKKNVTIEKLTQENNTLRMEKEQLQNEIEDLKSRPQNHSRLSLASAVSSHSNRTDASAVQGNSWAPGSPWSTAYSLSPDVARKSSNGPRPRRQHFLLPMSDIEAYGKGLNPHHTHFAYSRTPSPRSVCTKDSLESELNGNDLDAEDR